MPVMLTQSQRAVVLFGALLTICAAGLTTASQIKTRMDRSEIVARLERARGTATPEQLASDQYHLVHYDADLAGAWAPTGPATIGAVLSVIGLALVVTPIVRARHSNART